VRENFYSKEIDARELACNGEFLDRLYICTICNSVFLFKFDVKDHDSITGHGCQESTISVWLDDVIGLDHLQLVYS
jgi:hypothetical protein